MFLLLFAAPGCAVLAPHDDLPPVPVGPAGQGLQAPVRRSQPPVPARPAVPPRPLGWDAPDPAPGPRAPLASVASDEEVMRMQILLDRANFSPGCIDGRWGAQTRAALRAWRVREGLPAGEAIDDALRARLPSATEAFTTHVVSGEDHAGLAPVPATWTGKAQAAELAHATVLERLAEQYHLTQRALKELNPAAAWPAPPQGVVLRVPQVSGYPRVQAARIEIHLAGKTLQVFGEDGGLVAHFPCSIARDKEKRPVGELHIANAAADPNYTFDPALFAGEPGAAGLTRRLLIPPGPNNPVGVAWLSLDRPGYGIHGTPHPEEIGRTESHGCFRLANWNARKLLRMVSIGTPVVVLE